jgi:hypothetical protein
MNANHVSPLNRYLIDISFCNHIQLAQIEAWRKKYPQLTIKKSYNPRKDRPEPVRVVHAL